MKPCSILIVEDHPFQHLYLQNLFSELGDFDLVCARDGEEALACLKQRDFDLVLTDLLMPGMDGVQFIQGLAAQPSRPALAIMSAASRRMLMGASLVASNLQVKVIGLISKPVNAAALRCLTDQLLALRQVVPAEAQPGIDCQSLTNALVNGELQAWFQPKKALSNGRIVAAEALVRWVHPEHGLLLPGVFLPALIACHLEERLLWCVLKQAMAAQAVWRQQGYDIPVSINLPTHLLNSHDLPDRILAFVLEHQGLPARICFELMECSVPDDISNFYAGACRLRIKGFGLSQDDFGKGYSSYMNLVSAPFTEVKIDRALVQGCNNSQSLNLAGSVVGHGGGINLGQTVGETFALAQVEGVSVVKIGSFSGAKTGSNGYAVVPNAQPYRVNWISLDTRDLGADIEIDNATQQVVPRRGAVVLARYVSKTGRRVQFALFDAKQQPIPFGASLEDTAGKQMAISDPNGKALALVEQDTGTLVIKWGEQQCQANYALGERNKALNYERVDLKCTPQFQEHQ